MAPSSSKKESIEVSLARSKDPSLDEVLSCAEKIKEEGNVFIIKADEQGYSVSILYPLSTERENVEAESRVLIKACMKAVRQHFSNKNTE